METVSRTDITNAPPARKLRLWLGLLIGGGLAWLLMIGYAERKLEGARLWLVGATYDAGVVRPGTVIEHRVWVINPLAHSLQLDVVPHCGCTVIEEAHQVLPPFWVVPLTVRVDTTGKSAGEHLQRVELVVRDGRFSWREGIAVRFTVSSASQSR
ncbi:MAG: hypothetical protein D6687_04435 [Acidobacteria bacterium]|jgi:hypothetical protein|nr:MAG: hypothetical protein D6687_04435 [Acidobacteriota bacterium]